MSKPKGHKDNCQCVICNQNRNKPLPCTISEYYERERNGKLSIWRTALDFYNAFFKWFYEGEHTLDWVGDFLFDLYQKPRCIDGYALVLLSPLMLIWWVFCTILFFTYIGVVVVMVILTASPFPLLWIYTILFEAPASALNHDFDKVDKSKVGKWSGITKRYE